MPLVDIFCPSIEEAFSSLFPDRYKALREKHPEQDLLQYFTPGDFRLVAETLLSMGCAVVGLKAGPNGWYLRCSDENRINQMGKLKPDTIKAWACRELWHPGFVADTVVSATGAGDVSIAAFLTAMLNGHGPVECMKLANAAGWANLKTLDALGAVPGWDELTKLSAALTAHEVSRLRNEKGWSWNGPEGVWEGS
ncbi:MAG: hypothetical protein GF418_02260 [Chitinivibrionales bacterium]|nr:hypothetical protein [Chitinivibrionales bacterium]MBD3394425.1 hypothetical protein [Chitinivibrionales bacterium]